MTQSAIVPTPAASPALASLDDRAAATFGDDSTDGAEGAVSTEQQPAGAPDPLAAARAERRAKLDELRAKERTRVDAHSVVRERDELRAKQKELEAQLTSRLDPNALDEEKFFALAEGMKLPPQKLYEWLKSRAENPEAAMIRREVDPQIAELRRQNEALQAKLDGFVDKVETREASAAQQQHEAGFCTFAQANAATSPLATRFLERHGVSEFIKVAEGAAEALPRGAGPQALLDEIEERLNHVAATFTGQPSPAQRTQANPPRPNPAAAQAPTHVTNSLAQQRSSVVDEDARFAGLNLEERAALAFDC